MATAPAPHASVADTAAPTASLGPNKPTRQLRRATAASSRANGKKKRSHTTPTRDRERRELLALRVEVVERQKQLEQARERLATVRKKNQERIAASGSRIVSVAAWRHIAQRYRKAREAAESENRRLREQLAEQLKWGDALQSKMMQRTKQGKSHAATAAALGTVAHPLLLAEDEEGITDLELELDEVDRAELEMLASGLDAAYSQTEGVFKDHSVGEVALGDTAGSRKTLGSNADEAAVVELRDSRVIPFDFTLTIDASWNAWVLWHLGGSSRKSVSAQRSCSYPDVARPEHTFAVKFRLQTAAAQVDSAASSFLDMKLVLRRYVEQDRMVLVWRGLSAGENELDGLYTDETGWVAIERMPPFQQVGDKKHQVVTATARTSMRSCVRMATKRAEGCAATQMQGRTLADLVVNSYEEDVSFIYREMEAQLLRASRHV